ncbi:MAG: EpsI family protein, partial [Thermodesulfobacteriota bacterium]|nr:EpsI family protein [Thermodesulfobacteriota bacterium]
MRLKTGLQKLQVWRFYTLYFLIGLTAIFVYTRTEMSVPVGKSLELFPQQAGDWSMTGQARFDERVLAVLLPTDYLSRTYIDKQNNSVSLYIGYHDGGPLSGPIHSPKQCLPGSGWDRLSDQVYPVDVNGEQVDYVGAIYQKDAERQLFLYWFQVRDQILTNEYALKLAMAKNS